MGEMWGDVGRYSASRGEGLSLEEKLRTVGRCGDENLHATPPHGGVDKTVGRGCRRASWPRSGGGCCYAVGEARTCIETGESARSGEETSSASSSASSISA
jgi:hypothetical protein